MFGNLKDMYGRVCSRLHARAIIGINVLRNQRGAQAIEYIAIGAIVVALLSGILNVVKDDTSIPSLFLEKITAFINKFG